MEERELHEKADTFTGGLPPDWPTSEVAPAVPVPLPPAFTLEARPEPLWLKRLMIAVFLPVLLTGGNPVMGAILGMNVALLVPEIPPYLGMLMGLGFLTTPTLVGLAVLYHRHLQYRPCIVDERGVVFGRTAKWEGERLRWERLKGFQITGNGIMLTVVGRPLTRWLGPTIQSEDRLTAEVVAFLESRGVPRLDG